MDSNAQDTPAAANSMLQTERAALEECLRSYDNVIASLRGRADHTRQLPAATQRAETLALVRRLTADLNEASAAGSDFRAEAETANVRSRMRTGNSKRWVAATVACSLLALAAWWLLQRPLELARAHLQGSWRQFETHEAGEKGKSYYRTFTATEMRTFMSMPGNPQWHAYDRRFEVTPATEFLVLRTTNIPGERVIAGAEFYILLLENKIYELRGIHPLDPMRETVINLWRPVEAVPGAPPSN